VTLLLVIKTIDVEPDAEMEQFYAKLQSGAAGQMRNSSSVLILSVWLPDFER
jgi:hypothetical protein